MGHLHRQANIMNKRTFLTLALLLLPVLSFAQGPGEPGGIPNPLKFDSIQEAILGAVDIATTIGFYVAVFFIIYSGFLFVKARGNPEGIKSAKEAFLWTVIGTAVLIGARVIADVVQGTIDQLEARQVDPQHETINV